MSIVDFVGFFVPSSSENDTYQSHILHILNTTVIKTLYTELVYDKTELHSENLYPYFKRVLSKIAALHFEE